ncbi:MAG: alpha/beta hydrolase [Sphingomonas sp.]|uniref:alpha/beta fold hydrolase n=1 Tax=Sphingomonas sp. TaxID=28214 RepID=UPI001AD199DE|nr:alpha/beta hydrolase [Sphingomonas sp.]MBN8808557.1 alpha/beta hydrolase [Sphingomonas sp.]
MASPDHVRRSYPNGSALSEWTAPDGWRLRRFDWPQPSGGALRGSILFQGGRGDILEKYLETFGHWHARGWAITSFDWRGQGGSGRIAPDPNVGDIDTFESYLRDFAGFWREWTASAPGPHVLMGHSMGGHLVGRVLAEGIATPAAAVLVAPMMGLHAPVGPRFGEALAKLVIRLGDPRRRAWKGNERPGTTVTRQDLLTHDPDRYADEPWWWEHKPELRLGPPSWRWVVRAFESTRALRDGGRLGGIATPVLMLVADADKLVRADAAVAVGEAMPNCRIVRFGDESAHEILREADPVRDRALAVIDAFLDEKVTA